MDITRVPNKQCTKCNIGTLRDTSVDGGTEVVSTCDWCSAKVYEN